MRARWRGGGCLDDARRGDESSSSTRVGQPEDLTDDAATVTETGTDVASPPMDAAPTPDGADAGGITFVADAHRPVAEDLSAE